MDEKHEIHKLLRTGHTVKYLYHIQEAEFKEIFSILFHVANLFDHMDDTYCS